MDQQALVGHILQILAQYQIPQDGVQMLFRHFSPEQLYGFLSGFLNNPQHLPQLPTNLNALLNDLRANELLVLQQHQQQLLQQQQQAQQPQPPLVPSAPTPQYPQVQQPHYPDQHPHPTHLDSQHRALSAPAFQAPQSPSVPEGHAKDPRLSSLPSKLENLSLPPKSSSSGVPHTQSSGHESPSAPLPVKDKPPRQRPASVAPTPTSPSKKSLTPSSTSSSLERPSGSTKSRAPSLRMGGHKGTEPILPSHGSSSSSPSLSSSSSSSSSSGTQVESNLQVRLENMLLDAFRISNRLRLGEVDFKAKLDRYAQLKEKKAEINRVRLEKQKSISELSGQLKQAREARDIKSAEYLDTLNKLLQYIIGFSANFMTAQTPLIEQMYLNLVQRDNIKLPFLSGAQGADPAYLPVLESPGIDQRLCSMQQLFLWFESLLRTKDSIMSEVKNIEEELISIEQITNSLGDLEVLMKQTIAQSTNLTTTVTDAYANLFSLKQTIESLGYMMSSTEYPSILADNSLNPLLRQAFDQAKNSISAMIPEDYHEYESWTQENSLILSSDIVYTKEPIPNQPLPEVVKATVPRLIELLTNEKYPDQLFTKSFLLTYKSFMSASDLLDRLILRYCLSPPPESDQNLLELKKSRQIPVRLRVLNVIKYWVTHHFQSDLKDDLLVENICNFLQNTVSQTGYGSIASQILNKLQKRANNFMTAKVLNYVQPPPKPEVPAGRDITFRNVTALEMARQLTLRDENLLKEIRGYEFLGLRWTKPDRLITAPGVCAFTETHTKTTNWIIWEVLNSVGLEDRVLSLKKFIQIIKALLELNNYNSAIAITDALCSPAIVRLRKSWQMVGAEAFTTVSSTRDLMRDKATKYREKLKSAVPPFIPYIKVWQQDLIELQESSPDIVDGNLINFSKMRSVADVILSLESMQNGYYSLLPLDGVQKYLSGIGNDSFLEECEAINASVALEPAKIVADAVCPWVTST